MPSKNKIRNLTIRLVATAAVSILGLLSLGAEKPTTRYDNGKAIAYAKQWAGKNGNSCGVYLNEPGKTDCAHFIAHCLHAGGITIKNSDPTIKLCPDGLAVRNTDLVNGLKTLAASYRNVREFGLTDAIIGDIGFLNRPDRPTHAFMVCKPVNLGDLSKGVTVYAHSTNRNCEEMDAEFRQWFATMFNLTDGR